MANNIISLVVPLYNKSAAIEATLQSVFRQTQPPAKLIVVNDGSTDGSREVAAATLAKAPDHIDWQLIHQANAGVSSARNAGAVASTTPFVAFLDADDEWLPECLEEMTRLVTHFPDAAIASVRLSRRSASGLVVADSGAVPDDHFGIVANPIAAYRRGYGILSSSSVVVRRDAFDAVGGFPQGEAKGEDIYLWLRLLLCGQLAHSSRPLSIWRIGYTGVGAREGALPYHLRYFLGTERGRSFLGNPDLRAFLASNLVVQLAGHRLAGDDRVVRALRQISRYLGPATVLKASATSLAPRAFLRAAASWRRRRLR